MLVIDNGDAIRGIAEVASQLDFIVNGYVGTTATQLADGQLGSTEADLYASGADGTVVTSITIVNTDSAARTFTLYLKPSGGTSRAISPVSLDLGVGHSFYTDGQRMTVLDKLGQVLSTWAVDDTPVNGETDKPISSNWAFDHVAAADPHTGYVLETLFGAHSIIMAVSNNTPIKLDVAASRFVGRKASGNIAAMTGAEAIALLSGANLDVGAYNVRGATLTADGLTSGRVVFAGASGLLSDDADFTFSVDTLTVTKIGAFTLAGSINAGGNTIANINDISIGVITAGAMVNTTDTTNRILLQATGITLQTNNGSASASSRLAISEGVEATMAWTLCNHTGLKLGGALDANGQNLNNLGTLSAFTAGGQISLGTQHLQWGSGTEIYDDGTTFVFLGKKPISFYTLNSGSANALRLNITNLVDTATAEWQNIIHTGFKLGGDLDFNAKNLVTDISTGTKIGTATNQKIGFFGDTPVVQLAKGSYNNWAALSDVVNALVAIGLFDVA